MQNPYLLCQQMTVILKKVKTLNKITLNKKDKAEVIRLDKQKERLKIIAHRL